MNQRNRGSHVLFLSLAAALSFSAIACGEKKPAESPDNTQVEQPTTTVEPSTGEDDGSKAQLNISDEIKKACNITTTDAYFGFDSSNVLPQAQELLKKLATCFTTGPLAKRQMRLVGHADPRGDEDYNMVLGGKRADSLKGALEKVGLPGSQIETSSRGEIDATGTDEASWARDRRVDITLGN